MSIDPATEAALFAATRTIAQEVILPRYRALATSEVETKTHRFDLVTVADRESEERLTEAVNSILPDAAVVGEEAVAADASVLDRVNSDLAVVIDPIDGTWNFANGVNSFGVILAITAQGQTIWGGIYDPLADDWMVARAGSGAWFIASDGSTRSVSVGQGGDTAEDVSGILPFYLYHPEERQQLAQLMPTFRRMGTLRCSAHEYRLLADGREDFSVTAHLNPWDHAAGVLLLTEAGGVARMIDGRAYAPTLSKGRMLCARSETLWRDLQARLHFLAESE